LNEAPAPPTEKEEQPKKEQTQELSASFSVQDPNHPSMEKPFKCRWRN